jgi:hypothetical protein
MSSDAGFDNDWRDGSPQEQARHWERKLDLLLRLEAEALVERLSIRSREPYQAGAAHGGMVEK